MINFLNNNEIEFLENDELRKYNTVKVGGTAKVVCFPHDNEQLIKILKFVNQNQIKVFIIGNGSNLIFADDYFDGCIINLKKLNNDYKVNKDVLTIGSGYMITKLNFELAKTSFNGLEFASGIPGTIGGVIYMNAGAYKDDISNHLIDVTYLDENFNVKTISTSECKFNYRTSIFQTNKNWIILSANIKLKQMQEGESKEIINRRKKVRMDSQPLDKPSFGSTFKNPGPEIAAWKVIDDLGLRGYSYGGIMFSEKHSNFLVNFDNATCNDIEQIIAHAQKLAKEKFNIELETEVKFLKW